ncbi:hypothetical protein [Agrobacterium sp. DKPNP3]|uniref:hypothetical protein n=1 Tax=Agrobacterium sp. DKPNP3 TaxID=3457323 RepID=UPI0040449B93
MIPDEIGKRAAAVGTRFRYPVDGLHGNAILKAGGLCRVANARDNVSITRLGGGAADGICAEWRRVETDACGRDETREQLSS